MIRLSVVRRRVRAGRRVDLPHALWRLLTSVRFALWLIGFVALSGLLGVLIPQVPPAMRGDATAVAGWLQFESGKFGVFTEPMHRLGLFDVFDTRWFQAGLGLLAIAIAVCVGNRFPPIWRTIRRPPKRVADSYLRRAHHHAEFATPAEAGAFERVLARRHYRVQRFEENGAVYLFADRFQWAQLGTFASHLALIVFMVAGLVSVATGYETQLFIAKGWDAPIYPVNNPNQIQVHLDDTLGRFDQRGRPLDYRSMLTLSRNGREVKRCVATVNDPCSYGGFRFSQAAYFGFGAELLVRDLTANRVVYDEVLQLKDQMPGPHLAVRDDAGRLLLDQTVVMRTSLAGTFLSRVTVPQTNRSFLVGVRPDEDHHRWSMVVLESRPDGGQEAAARLLLVPGQEGALSGLHFQFSSLAALPAATRSDVPAAPSSSADGGQAPVLLQMTNAIFGSSESSSGRALPVAPVNGPPTLYISGIGTEPAALRQGESVSIDGFEYSFLGQRAFAGIQVKRDQGALFMWIAIALLVGGTAITFHVPRRRLWAKITPQRTYVAGIAGHLVDFGKELHELGAEAGASDTAAADEQIHAR
ncbi:MAG TPA: cytochrome c biogenesis protein ResB [Dehalococcoidia bacterium]|nr:cytochrome c biogenesis protein ResB [Dehalococcoidia bacterium]